MMWWIIPALCGVVGLMLGFAGISRLIRANFVSGGVRALLGVGFLGAAGVAVFAGLNLQTYKRLTHEQLAATVYFIQVENEANKYVANITYPGDESLSKTYTLTGDEFEIGAQVIKFKPLANILGYDTVYRLEYLSGRFRERFVYDKVTTAEVTGVKLSDDPGLDVAAFVKQNGTRFGLEAVGISGGQEDARYGSAVYVPMSHDLKYEIMVTQDAVIARPANENAAKAVGTQDYPGTKTKR